MLTRMPSEESEWGPKLHAYLLRQSLARGVSLNAWIDAHPGIQGPTVSRWRTGTVPMLPAMRAVADGLGVSLVDVLLAAGVLDKKEVGHDAAVPPVPDIHAAIASDPNLSADLRALLRSLVDKFQKVESGQSSHERGRVGPPRRRRKAE